MPSSYCTKQGHVLWDRFAVTKRADRQLPSQRPESGRAFSLLLTQATSTDNWAMYTTNCYNCTTHTAKWPRARHHSKSRKTTHHGPALFERARPRKPTRGQTVKGSCRAFSLLLTESTTFLSSRKEGGTQQSLGIKPCSAPATVAGEILKDFKLRSRGYIK